MGMIAISKIVDGKRVTERVEETPEQQAARESAGPKPEFLLTTAKAVREALTATRRSIRGKAEAGDETMKDIMEDLFTAGDIDVLSTDFQQAVDYLISTGDATPELLTLAKRT